jgi:hypothetical protein
VHLLAFDLRAQSSPLFDCLCQPTQ